MNQQRTEQTWRPVGEALERIDQADSGRPRGDFLILGAGIAGLAAAYELGRRGHQVEILESTQDRVGGRLWTWRSEDGRFYGERGAMRIPHNHDYTYHYLAEAGLTASDLRPFQNSLGTGYLVVGDVVARESEYSEKIFPLFCDGLKPEEREAASENPGGLLGYYLGPLIKQLPTERQRALLAGDFSDPFLAALDRTSVLDYFRNKGASSAALEVLGRVLGLKAVWEWSLAAFLRDELHHPDPRFEEIIGGFDRLPRNLRDRLPPSVELRFNQEVLDIDPTRSIVQVKDRATGQSYEKSFQHLLVTLPFPVLKKMGLEGFSAAKTEAIRSMRYASACKDLLAYETRFWEQEGIRGGRSKTDGPDEKVLYFREAYYPMDRLPPEEPAPKGLSFRVAPGQDLEGLFSLYVGSTQASRAAVPLAEGATAPPGTILGSYTLNGGAQALQDLPHEDRRRKVLESLREAHGDAVDGFAHYFPWSWDNYQWTRGGFGITPPDFLVDHWAEAKRPENGVYFAGEHLSIAPGWIQGALESSLREVEAMLLETETTA